MRILIQRVKSASVTIGGQLRSQIGAGLLVLLGVYPKPALDVINPAVEDTLSSIHQPDPPPALTAGATK